jgi:glycosyltransferase involved in cell wall biosynthesis
MIADTPKVSIILPVYNGGATLISAVRSIVDQSYTDWEMIVLDDGSTDDYVRSLEELSDRRIKVQSDGLRKGLATRLNEGIDQSRGLYIARMDADDLCFPNRLEKQVDYLDDHPKIDLVATRAIGFSGNKGGLSFSMLPYREKHEQLCASPWDGIYMPHPSWMGRAVWFRRYRYRMPEVLRAEDQELLLRAMPESRYYCLPAVLLAYRQGSFQLRKSLLARRELFKCQINIFLGRRQWEFLLRTCWLTLQKMGFDLLRGSISNLATSKLKRSEDISPEKLGEFHLLLQKYDGATNALLTKINLSNKP